MNAFLSVASKAAALALLVRVAIGFAVAPPAAEGPTPTAVGSVMTQEAALFNVAAESSQGTEAEVQEGADPPRFIVGPAQLRAFIGVLIAVLAAITCTFGNLRLTVSGTSTACWPIPPLLTPAT